MCSNWNAIYDGHNDNQNSEVKMEESFLMVIQGDEVGDSGTCGEFMTRGMRTYANSSNGRSCQKSCRQLCVRKEQLLTGVVSQEIQSQARCMRWDLDWMRSNYEIVTPTQLFYECNNEFNGLEISLQIVGAWWKKKKEGQVMCIELAYGSSFQGIPTQSSNESGRWNRTLLSNILFRIWIARTWPIHCFTSGAVRVASMQWAVAWLVSQAKNRYKC